MYKRKLHVGTHATLVPHLHKKVKRLFSKVNILKILKTPNPEDIQLLKTKNLTIHKTENICRMLEEVEELKTSAKKLFLVKLFIYCKYSNLL